MYLVTGMTGDTGGAVATALLEHKMPIRALVRDPEQARSWASRGVELVQGDLLNHTDVATAMTGVESAYFVVPRKMDATDVCAYYLTMGDAVGQAAEAAKLPRLVFLSAEGAHLTHAPRLLAAIGQVEARLRKLPSTQVTVLRASYFLENWLPFIGLSEQQGILPSMLAPTDRALSMVSAKDVGWVAAELLTNPNAPALVELQGPESYSPSDIAIALSATLGRTVNAIVIPPEQRVEAAMQGGFGPDYAKLLAEGMGAFNNGLIQMSGEGVQRRGTTTPKALFESIQLSQV